MAANGMVAQRVVVGQDLARVVLVDQRAPAQRLDGQRQREGQQQHQHDVADDGHELRAQQVHDLGDEVLVRRR